MRRKSSQLVGVGVFAGLLALGCASSPAAPFDTLKTSNLTAYRLQNYEPPAAATAATGAPIAGIPPEIQQWVQAGAAGLQQLIPPGVLPPGVTLPGMPTAQATQPAVQQVPRFPNSPQGFRILSQTQVMDSELKEQLGDLLGDADNFSNEHAACLYAEIGLSFGGNTGMPTNDVLISFSCNQVAAAGGFAWPHPNTGMKSDTVKKLAEVVNRLFPPGT